MSQEAVTIVPLAKWGTVVTLSELLHFLGPWPLVALCLGALLIPALTLSIVGARSIALGPFKIAAKQLDDLSIAMAESRIAELEVAVRQMISPLSESDRATLRTEIEKLKFVLKKYQKV